MQAQTTVYSQISLPSNGSVELRYEVSVTTSIGIVYISESVANPNAALYDATFIVNVVSSLVLNKSPCLKPLSKLSRSKSAAYVGVIFYFLKTPVLRFSCLAKQFSEALHIGLLFIVFFCSKQYYVHSGSDISVLQCHRHVVEHQQKEEANGDECHKPPVHCFQK